MEFGDFRVQFGLFLLLVLALIPATVPSSNSPGEFLNIHVERSVPKSEAKNLKPLADEDDPENPEDPVPPPSEGDPSGSTPVNSTSKAECLATVSNSGSRSVCCLQYTWHGFVNNPHLVETKTARNCSDVKKEDPNAICFGPLVYSNATTSRPDPVLVSEICDADSHDCFCAGLTCVTYVIYDNVNGKVRKNETHFCGLVKSKNTNEAVTNGCFSEKKADGSTHEVCVCHNEPFCNSATLSCISSNILFLALLISMCLNFLTPKFFS